MGFAVGQGASPMALTTCEPTWPQLLLATPLVPRAKEQPMCEPPWKPFPELNVRDKLERRQRVPTHAQSVLCGSHPRARGCHTPSQKPKARAQHGHPWSH